MNKKLSFAAGAAAIAFAATAGMREYNSVDLFWGSGGVTLPPSEGIARCWNWEKAQTGNTHPGAVMPFGWVSACAFSGAYPSGYGRFGVSSCGPAPCVDARKFASGFTHFHHSGTGWIGIFYNYLLFTPYASGSDITRRSRLDGEKAHPGWYSATLTDYATSFEVTASRFAACHRYRFPSGKGMLRMNANVAGFRDEFRNGIRPNYREQAEVLDLRETGPGRWDGCFKAQGVKMFFALRAKAEITSSVCRDGVLALAFGGTGAETAIGFSLVGADEAAARADEAAALGFDALRNSAADAWKGMLGRVRAKFADSAVERRFYSTLYHSLVKPVDCGGGTFTDFSTMWDVYHTALPLALSIAPKTARGIAEHLMSVTERHGFAPICQLMWDRVIHKDVQATALPVLTLSDAFFRGVLTAADYPRLKGVFEKEFAHADISGMSPTHALDLSQAYRAAAFVAEACGDAGYAKDLCAKCGVWKEAYDSATGLLHEKAKYYEGNHFNYSFRPHPGMGARVELAGGVEGFREKLDAFFGIGTQPSGWSAERDRVRRVNHFEGLNNESDMDAPFAYVWCGRPDRTAEVVDAARRWRFGDGEGGCPGNNDSGGTSSWYVWGCLGLYPLAGAPYYLLGTPSVDSAEIDFAGGTLKIEVERESAKSIYPAGYSFGGRDFREPWLPVEKLEKGGVLKFRLTDRPAPPSPIPDWL